LYNKIFKYEQIVYGNPYKVKYKKTFNDAKTYESDCQAEGDPESNGSNIEVDPECILEKARNNAEIILESARVEAQNIIENAKTEANLILDNAKKEALEMEAHIAVTARKEGFETGIAEAHKEYEEKIKNAEQLLEETVNECRILLQGMESDIVSLAVAIAEKVLDKELKTDMDYILHLAKCALEQCADKSSITLRVSKPDYAHLSKNKERFLSMLNGVEELEIKQDLSLKPGACIVATPIGNIDASVDKKLKNIENEFEALIENGETI